MTNAEIARVLEARPQLPHPFKLAVVFLPIRHDWLRFGRAAMAGGWTGADKDALLERLSALVGGPLTQVIPVVEGTAASDDIKGLRLAAARHGADAVLVVGGATDVDRYNNAWSALYVTIVGAFIAPGTEADALFIASATLWDVRNEYLYASAETEAIEHHQGSVLLDDGRLVVSARAKATAALAAEVERRLRTLAGPEGRHP